jgi:hypothetical protein
MGVRSLGAASDTPCLHACLGCAADLVWCNWAALVLMQHEMGWMQPMLSA